MNTFELKHTYTASKPNELLLISDDSKLHLSKTIKNKIMNEDYKIFKFNTDNYNISENMVKLTYNDLIEMENICSVVSCFFGYIILDDKGDIIYIVKLKLNGINFSEQISQELINIKIGLKVEYIYSSINSIVFYFCNCVLVTCKCIRNTITTHYIKEVEGFACQTHYILLYKNGKIIPFFVNTCGMNLNYEFSVFILGRMIFQMKKVMLWSNHTFDFDGIDPNDIVSIDLSVNIIIVLKSGKILLLHIDCTFKPQVNLVLKASLYPNIKAIKNINGTIILETAMGAYIAGSPLFNIDPDLSISERYLTEYQLLDSDIECINYYDDVFLFTCNQYSKIVGVLHSYDLITLPKIKDIICKYTYSSFIVNFIFILDDNELIIIKFCRDLMNITTKQVNLSEILDLSEEIEKVYVKCSVPESYI